MKLDFKWKYLLCFIIADTVFLLGGAVQVSTWLYPQIRLLFGIKTKAALSLPFNVHCEAMAAKCFVLNSVLSSYLKTLPFFTLMGGISAYFGLHNLPY